MKYGQKRKIRRAKKAVNPCPQCARELQTVKTFGYDPIPCWFCSNCGYDPIDTTYKKEN